MDTVTVNDSPKEPEATPEATPEVKQESQEQDIISRVSQYQQENSDKVTEEKPGDVDFDINGIENVKTIEEAKEWAKNSHKSWQTGFNGKFQEISEMRKSLEAEREQLKAQMENPNVQWTPEKVQSLLNDQSFLTAAREVENSSQSQVATDDYSVLSEQEKQELLKVRKLEEELSSLKQERQMAILSQQDSELKNKYPVAYDVEKVNSYINKFQSGELQATKEHIFKAIDYDSAIKRAYNMGLQDKNLDVTEKINASSIDATTTSRDDGPVQQNEKEDSKSWFIRNALNRLSASKAANMRK
jgi:hypothetical protein